MILRTHISDEQIKEIVPDGGMVKIVADLKRGILSVDCAFHMDCAVELQEDGSLGQNLWGANVYMAQKRIDFVALINIRPSAGNRTMEIQEPSIREQVENIIKKLLF